MRMPASSREKATAKLPKDASARQGAATATAADGTVPAAATAGGTAGGGGGGGGGGAGGGGGGGGPSSLAASVEVVNFTQELKSREQVCFVMT
jgi:hypothetical protein